MKYVVKPDDVTELRHLDCLVKRLIHPRTVGSVNVATSIAIVDPGKEIKSHNHSFEEAYFVAEGGARMRVGSEEFDVELWDSVYIPSNVEHWTLNSGQARLVLICALSPPPDM